jgi:hypothetical protein
LPAVFLEPVTAVKALDRSAHVRDRVLGKRGPLRPEELRALLGFEVPRRVVLDRIREEEIDPPAQEQDLVATKEEHVDRDREAGAHRNTIAPRPIPAQRLCV